MEKNQTLKTIVYTKNSCLGTYIGRYRFSFNGQEKDNEVKGAGNSIAFENRIYDPRLGRWMSLDPEMKKFADMSPYNGFANNPILFKDPDGREIIIATKNQKATLATLQKLTNDKLYIKNGKIIIVAHGGQNSSKTLSYGTKLVSDLVGDRSHKVEIKDYDSQHKEDQLVPKNIINASNSKGSDAVLYFKNEEGGIKFGAGKNQDGSEYTEEQNTLAHELIHSRNSFKGKVDYRPNPAKDPDKASNDPNSKKLTNEEVNTRKDENIVRLEQGAKPEKLRLIPIKK